MFLRFFTSTASGVYAIVVCTLLVFSFSPELFSQSKATKDLYFRTFQYGFQQDACLCKLIIDSTKTITTVNSGCDSACKYPLGTNKQQVNYADYKKFIKYLSSPKLLVAKENNFNSTQISYGVSYKSINIITTYNGNLMINEFSSFDAQDSLWNHIWKIRCNTGLVDSSYLIDNSMYWEKIICYYPETANDFKSHFIINENGELMDSKFKGSNQSASIIDYLSAHELSKISEKTRALTFAAQKSITFNRYTTQKLQKRMCVVQTNKGIYEITSEDLKRHLFALYKEKAQ